MPKSIRTIALECFLDLGVTIVYAAIVGLLIVGIVASDDGPASLIKAALYASLLPMSVVGMILVDLAFRLVAARCKFQRRYAPLTPRPF